MGSRSGIGGDVVCLVIIGGLFGYALVKLVPMLP